SPSCGSPRAAVSVRTTRTGTWSSTRRSRGTGLRTRTRRGSTSFTRTRSTSSATRATRTSPSSSTRACSPRITPGSGPVRTREDTREGWAAAFRDLIETYYRPAKNRRRVFDVSRVRWQGARLMTSGGHASGPVPLARLLHDIAGIMNRRIGQRLDGIGAMEIDHAIAKAVVAGGNRRSARMAIMHWRDPQIFEFIRIKQTTGEHWTTNISVEVDDEFFEAIGDPESLDWDIRPYDVLTSIAEGMLNNGEPGFWNSSYSNQGEPNRVIA